MEYNEKGTLNRMQLLREEKGLNMKEAAAQLRLPYTTYRNYEQGLREPNSEVLVQIANFYDVSVDYLIGRSQSRGVQSYEKSIIPAGFIPVPDMVSVPLIGSIACGTPILAEENIKQYIGIPAAWRADFALECHGDSMAPKICDGDIVCIRKQSEVETGQIAAVRIGEEATLKHFYRQGDVVQLIAENSAVCPPMIYSGQQLAEIQIEGLAVGFCRGL